MSTTYTSFMPALGLLLLLVLLAWVVQWMKKRVTPKGSGLGTELRLVSHLSLGPQQRIAVVEVQGPQGTVQLTLGVTPQHVRTLHTQHLPRHAPAPTAVAVAPATPAPTAAPSYQDVARSLPPAPTEASE